MSDMTAQELVQIRTKVLKIPTVSAMAAALNIPRPTYRKYETGDYKIPADTVGKINGMVAERAGAGPKDAALVKDPETPPLPPSHPEDPKSEPKKSPAKKTKPEPEPEVKTEPGPKPEAKPKPKSVTITEGSQDDIIEKAVAAAMAMAVEVFGIGAVVPTTKKKLKYAIHIYEVMDE